MTSLMDSYLPVAMLTLVGIGFILISMLLSRITRPSKPDEVKKRTYECAEIPIGDMKIHHNIQYYLFVIAFIIFDVEMAFMYPWAVRFRELGLFGFVEMFIFIGVLVIGLIYLWKKEALQWAQ